MCKKVFRVTEHKVGEDIKPPKDYLTWQFVKSETVVLAPSVAVERVTLPANTAVFVTWGRSG